MAEMLSEPIRKSTVFGMGAQSACGLSVSAARTALVLEGFSVWSERVKTPQPESAGARRRGTLAPPPPLSRVHDSQSKLKATPWPGTGAVIGGLSRGRPGVALKDLPGCLGGPGGHGGRSLSLARTHPLANFD